MLPTCIIEDSQLIARSEPQYFSQMRQFFADDRTALIVDSFFRQKESSHQTLPPAKQKRNPLLFPFTTYDFEMCDKLIDHLAALWIQNPGEDQETLGSNLGL